MLLVAIAPGHPKHLNLISVILSSILFSSFGRLLPVSPAAFASGTRWSLASFRSSAASRSSCSRTGHSYYSRDRQDSFHMIGAAVLAINIFLRRGFLKDFDYFSAIAAFVFIYRHGFSFKIS
jgi:hypothetical protein